MPAGHLVAHRDHALGGHVDLDHLQHAAAAVRRRASSSSASAPWRRSPPRPPARGSCGSSPRRPCAAGCGCRASRCRTAGPARPRSGAPGPRPAGCVLVGELLLEHFLDLLDQLAEGPAIRSFPWPRPPSGPPRSLALVLAEAHAAGEFWVSITMPSMPEGTSSESFFTSSPARPKMACSSFSSGVSSVFDFGRDLAHQDVAGPDVGADAGRCRSRRGCAAAAR